MSRVWIEELRAKLPTSMTEQRKAWGRQLVRDNVCVQELLILLHGEKKVAQRFTWLISDLLELHPSAVTPAFPILFSLRDQMPFPGMRRMVAKCIWTLGVHQSMEAEIIPQLFQWLDDDTFRVGVKHYSAKALYDLSLDGRVDGKRVLRSLKKQSKHENLAHAKRMTKLRGQLEKALS